jgi:hypothetical protein
MMAEWNKQKLQRDARLAAGAKFASGKLVFGRHDGTLRGGNSAG